MFYILTENEMNKLPKSKWEIGEIGLGGMESLEIAQAEIIDFLLVSEDDTDCDWFIVSEDGKKIAKYWMKDGQVYQQTLTDGDFSPSIIASF